MSIPSIQNSHCARSIIEEYNHQKIAADFAEMLNRGCRIFKTFKYSTATWIKMTDITLTTSINLSYIKMASIEL